MPAQFNIKSDDLDALINAAEALGGAVSGDDAKLVMGRAMQSVIKSHFSDIAQDEAHHKTARALGATPTGVYEEAARNTEDPVVEDDGVTVTIRQVAIAQRFYGGLIAPISRMFLTIPARAEAYGHRASEFDNLRFILFPSGAGALIDRDAPRGTPISESVYFWLVKHANQEPDETVLPADEDIIQQAKEAAALYIGLVWSSFFNS